MPEPQKTDTFEVDIDGETYEVDAPSALEAKILAHRAHSDVLKAQTKAELSKELDVAGSAAKNIIPSTAGHLWDAAKDTGKMVMRATESLVGSPADRVQSQMQFGDAVVGAPKAALDDLKTRYGTHEARQNTLANDPGSIVMDALMIAPVFKAMRAAGPAMVRGTGTALDAATATPGRRAIGGGIVGALTTGTPTGALVGADVAARGGGNLNRLAKTMRLFRSSNPEVPNLPLPPGATTPLSPESAGIVLPQPLRNNPLSLVKGMSKAGKAELADINAGERMVSGMSASAPPPSVDQSLMDALTQAFHQSPLEGVYAEGQPRLVKRPKAVIPSRGLTPAARTETLTKAAQQFGDEYKIANLHGKAGFSQVGVPQLPPEELARITEALDAILKRRTNPY